MWRPPETSPSQRCRCRMPLGVPDSRPENANGTLNWRVRSSKDTSLRVSLLRPAGFANAAVASSATRDERSTHGHAARAGCKEVELHTLHRLDVGLSERRIGQRRRCEYQNRGRYSVLALLDPRLPIIAPSEDVSDPRPAPPAAPCAKRSTLLHALVKPDEPRRENRRIRLELRREPPAFGHRRTAAWRR